VEAHFKEGGSTYMENSPLSHTYTTTQQHGDRQRDHTGISGRVSRDYMVYMDGERRVTDGSFHVHLRQGAMSKLVTPHVSLGGIKTAYVMVRALLWDLV